MWTYNCANHSAKEQSTIFFMTIDVSGQGAQLQNLTDTVTISMQPRTVRCTRPIVEASQTPREELLVRT